jgi:Tfp pilus assembly protein PilX
MTSRIPLVGRYGAQRGLAATAAALLLFLAMGIIVAFTNRSLVFEQRTAANQYRYTKAFEAAEAGLEWAIAMLNTKELVYSDCLSAAAGSSLAGTGQGFKSRYLNVDTSTGAITAGAVMPMCVISAGGYRCSCPPANPATVATEEGPAFMVRFESYGTPGIVRVYSYGCTSAAGECHPTSSGTPDATARVTALLGVIPAVGVVPGAAITARQALSWTGGTGAAMGVYNVDPESNGITINAGSTVTEGFAEIVTIQGSPASSSIIQDDTSLSSLTADQMFVSFMGMSLDQYRDSATIVTCPSSGSCDATLQAAYDATDPANRVFWIEGDLQLQGNVSWGDVNNPGVFVVNGNINLGGTMDVVGLLYAVGNWDTTGSGSALVRGASVTGGNFSGNGTTDFYYDASVLKKLVRTPGSFIKVPGSWKDF